MMYNETISGMDNAVKILYIISLFEKLENFIYKLLYIKNGEINFNYSYFDHFGKESYLVERMHFVD